MRGEFGWSAFFGWGLTLSGAALASFGCLGLFIALPELHALAACAFALTMAFAIACANVAADIAARAWRRSAWDVVVLAALTCAGFAFVANIGVHLGWELLIAGIGPAVHLPEGWQVEAAFYILCAAKPLVLACVSFAQRFAEEDDAADKARRDARGLAHAAASASHANAGPVHTAVSGPAGASHPPRSAERAASRPMTAPRPGVTRLVTRKEIVDACREILKRSEQPSIRKVADQLQVSRRQVSNAWPRGEPIAHAVAA